MFCRTEKFRLWSHCITSLTNDLSFHRFSSVLSIPVLNERRNPLINLDGQPPNNELMTLNTKVIKIAIIGSPNSGKSTLINKIIGRRVFAMSKKVHTTRCRARAIHNEKETQLVFLDTPGLVTSDESKKHRLEKSFLTDGERAMVEADIIGVVHDVGNPYTRLHLDEKVLRLLHIYAHKDSFLILNKIDQLKTIRHLLDLSTALTRGRTSNPQLNEAVQHEKLTEKDILALMKKQRHWPHFQDIFMVSALDGNGVGDIKAYLLERARPGDWLFPESTFTDQDPKQIIKEAVRSKLLEYLPQELPYNLGLELEYYDVQREGSIIAVVLVLCSKPHIEKLVIGIGGSRIKKIAKGAEEDLRNTFQAHVRLKVVVTKTITKSQ